MRTDDPRLRALLTSARRHGHMRGHQPVCPDGHRPPTQIIVPHGSFALLACCHARSGTPSCSRSHWLACFDAGPDEAVLVVELTYSEAQHLRHDRLTPEAARAFLGIPQRSRSAA